KVQGNNGDILQVDVLPDIQLSPVGEWEYANTFALVHATVVDIPQFRPLVFGIPAMVFVTEGVDPFFGSGFFFVPTSATKGSVEAVFVQSLFKALGFHNIGVLGTAVNKGADAHVHAVLVNVDDQVPTQIFDALI